MCMWSCGPYKTQQDSSVGHFSCRMPAQPRDGSAYVGVDEVPQSLDPEYGSAKGTLGEGSKTGWGAV